MLFSVRDPQDNFRFQFGPNNAAEAPGIYQQFTKARIDSSGKGFFDGGTQTGGADFAESVTVGGGKDNYEPGDVLVIDTDCGSPVDSGQNSLLNTCGRNIFNQAGRYGDSAYV